MNKPKESDLQKSIIDLLRLRSYLVVKFNNTGVYIKKLDRYMKSPQKGVSDLLFWGHGIFGAIECKMTTKPSPEQLLFLEDMRKKGGVGIVAYSLEDVLKAVK